MGKSTDIQSSKKKISRYQQRLSRDERSQKANFEGKRVNKPIILGYGKGLSASERFLAQKKLYFSFIGVIAAIIIGVFTFGLVNNLIILPNSPIVTVDGTNISQKTYYKMVAYLAQQNWNQVESLTNQVNSLSAQIAKNPKNVVQLQQQYAQLNTQLSSYQASFSQTQVDSLAVNDLIEDQLIQQGIAKFESTDPSAKKILDVTQSMIDSGYNSFVKAFPAGESVQNFLNSDHLSVNDVKAAIAVTLRRTAMQNYLQSLIKSPTLQMHLALIQVTSQTLANTILGQLKKDPTQFAALAKKYSVDSTSNTKGGDLGWVVQGQQDQGVEAWAFAQKTPNHISPVIKDINGTFDIVTILAIDPSRAVDPTLLQNLQQNALNHWLTGQRYLPPTVISSINTTYQTSTQNIPAVPSLNVTFQPTPTP